MVPVTYLPTTKLCSISNLIISRKNEHLVELMSRLVQATLFPCIFAHLVYLSC